jgi:CubicO group peptidase (beta-lactamase class C family)
MRLTLRTAALLLVLAAPLAAQAPAAAARSRATAGTVAGFDRARLARIDSTVERYLARGEVAGAVVLVLRDGQPVYERAFGWADREAGRRMTPDAIFRIASQSKAITSVAAMMLVEEGRLALGDPVGRYLPSFDRTTVLAGSDTAAPPVAAARRITVRDLLTQTAGISYGTEASVAQRYRAAGLGPAAGNGWYTADKDEPICTTMERLGTLPFVAQPGERWVYGYATDILGCVVERASGMPLDEFVRTRITAPLGMRDTHFFLPPEKAGRFTAVYMREPEAQVTRAPDGARGQGHYVEGPRRSFSGGAGLVSTARDYGRFLSMLLNQGALDGVRVLAPSTVRLMTANHTGTLFTRNGYGFSLGFELVQQEGAGGSPASVGTYAWGGAYGSNYLVDPVEKVVVLYMMQQIPARTDLSGRVPMLVYQALVDSRR